MSDVLPARPLAHERTVSRFALRMDEMFPEAPQAGEEPIAEALVAEEWESIKRAHGDLSNAFFREADAYALEMREKSGNWGTFTADLR